MTEGQQDNIRVALNLSASQLVHGLYVDPGSQGHRTRALTIQLPDSLTVYGQSTNPQISTS